MKEIPVVFTPDINYVIPTCVAIISMLENRKKDTYYLFYVVVSDDTYDMAVRYMAIVSKLYDSFGYEVKNIESKKFDSLKIFTGHLSASAYYRLCLAEVLPCEKCLYHDGDILVKQDLSDMYDVNMDDFYLAGVKNAYRQQNNEENKKHFKNWGNIKHDSYIFSGDLVINLKKIREDKIYYKFYEEMGKGYISEDQDVLNICCYGKIYFLPLKFCVLSRWALGKSIKHFENQVYSEKELIEAYNNPSIIHFAGSLKPWNNLRTLDSSAWWKYAEKILDKSEYEKMYKYASEKTLENDWSYLIRNVTNKKNIVIVGCGTIGRDIADSLKKWDYQIDCYADNDASKHGTTLNEINIISPKKATMLYPNAEWIVTIIKETKLIEKQLTVLGIQKENIHSFAKYKRYYQVISPEYYVEELRDIFLRERVENFENMKYEDMLSYLRQNPEIHMIWKKKYYLEHWLEG